MGSGISHVSVKVNLAGSPNRSNRGPRDIETKLEGLLHEAIVGKTYVAIAEGLLSADPVVFRAAKTFFSLTIVTNQQAAQMCAARLYDRTKGSLSVESLLSDAKNNAALFGNGAPSDFLQAVAEADTTIANLRPILASIKKRRNEALAHLGPKTVADPQALLKSAALTIPDLQSVFEETGKILNRLYAHYNGVYCNLDLLDVRDYETALKLIAEAICAKADAWEKRFNQPPDFPRPRSCK